MGKRQTSLFRGWSAALLALALAGPAAAQQPGAVDAAPLAPPSAAAPAAPPSPALPPTGGPAQAPAPTPPVITQPPATAQPAPPPAGAPVVAGRPTLVPEPGDPNDVDEVTLPAKPAIIVSGRSTWDDGFEQITGAFKRLEAALAKAGIVPAGRPLAVFLETDDMGFRYDAMIPVARAPGAPLAGSPEIRFGTTPEGKALRFVHEAPYDDIDSTYETITAYLDAKGVAVRDTFIEEYVNDPQDAADPDLRINIFVQPR